MKKQRTQKNMLTLHSLLGALSFWGTAVRTMLFGFLALFAYAIALTETGRGGAAAFAGESMLLIYALGSFLLLDFGYVMVARVYRLQKGLDVFVLMVAEVLLMLLYVTPKVVVSDTKGENIDPLVFVLFVPIIMLSARMLLGMLFGKKRT